MLMLGHAWHVGTRFRWAPPTVWWPRRACYYNKIFYNVMVLKLTEEEPYNILTWIHFQQRVIHYFRLVYLGHVSEFIRKQNSDERYR